LRIKDIKNRYAKAYRQWRSDPASICPPDGETLTDAFERVTEALIKLLKKRDETVAIVAAPIVAALIECAITREPLENLWQIVDQGKNVKSFTLESHAPDNAVPTGQLVETELLT
jgi:broad specificity phosphatase PhoE